MGGAGCVGPGRCTCGLGEGHGWGLGIAPVGWEGVAVGVMVHWQPEGIAPVGWEGVTWAWWSGASRRGMGVY